MTPDVINLGVQNDIIDAAVVAGLACAPCIYGETIDPLDSGKCTIGGQNEDSGKFHVRIHAARHR